MGSIVKRLLLAAGLALAGGATQAQIFGAIEWQQVPSSTACLLQANTTTGAISCGSAGGSPGGSSTYVQFNSAGAFAGVAGFTFDGTSVLTLGQAGTSVGGLKLANATSGYIELSPPTGALGSAVLTLPDLTATLLSYSGSLTSGHCLQANGSSQAVDSGAACGGSGSGPQLVTGWSGSTTNFADLNGTGIPMYCSTNTFSIPTSNGNRIKISAAVEGTDPGAGGYIDIIFVNASSQGYGISYKPGSGTANVFTVNSNSGASSILGQGSLPGGGYESVYMSMLLYQSTVAGTAQSQNGNVEGFTNYPWMSTSRVNDTTYNFSTTSGGPWKICYHAAQIPASVSVTFGAVGG